MFSFLTCCTGSNNTNDSDEFLNQESAKNNIINVYNLKNILDNKLGFIILYSNERDLIIFNNIKKDTDINLILAKSYKEIYKPVNSNFGQYIIKILDIGNKNQFFPLLVIILTLKNERTLNSKCLLSFLQKNEIDENSIKNIIKQYQYKNNTILPEPRSTSHNANHISKILFKFPDGKIIERNFLKNDKIINLYKFIQCSDINYDFNLIQLYPYKIFNEMNHTLEEEDLFPSSVIQIIKK
jgi:hypothetical protein